MINSLPFFLHILTIIFNISNAFVYTHVKMCITFMFAWHGCIAIMQSPVLLLNYSLKVSSTEAEDLEYII